MAQDCFLKVDGIPGESTDDKHKDWIEVLSYSHALSQQTSAGSGTGGGSAGRVTMSDFSIVKPVDKSTPHLALACCDGRHIKEIAVEKCRASGKKLPYLQYKMEDVIISSVQPSGTSGSERPTEHVTFSFGKISWAYTPIGRDGKAGTKVGPMGWDLVANKKV